MSTPERGEPGELARLVEQTENKFLQLQKRFSKLTDKHHYVAVDKIRRGNDPLLLSFDALNRIEKLEARLDSGELPPPRKRPARSAAGRRLPRSPGAAW